MSFLGKNKNQYTCLYKQLFIMTIINQIEEAMIMHKLFYKQYLRLSPFWRAYEQKKKLPPETFLANFKLLSSWIIIEKDNVPSHILELFNKYSNEVYDFDREAIYRACAYLGMQMPQIIQDYQSDDKYFSVLINYGKGKATAIEVMREFVQKVKQKKADDMDLLIISGMEHTIQSLNLLVGLNKLEWTQTAHQNFQKQIVRIMQTNKEGWSDIQSLKSVLKVMLQFEYLKYNREYSKLLYHIAELISDEIAQQNSNKMQSAQKMLKNAQEKNNQISNEMKNNKNAETLVRQYSVYLNWLFTRILISQTPEQFTRNFQQFLNLFMFQFENGSSQKEKKFLYINLLKLELIEVLMEILKTTDMKIMILISNQYNKKGQLIKTVKNRNLNEDLKRLQKKWEEKCQSIFSNEKINIIQCLGTLLEITGEIGSPFLRNKAKISIEQMMQKPIIILSDEQLMTGKVLTLSLGMNAHYQKLTTFISSKKYASEELQSDKLTNANQIKQKFITGIISGEIKDLEGLSVLYPKSSQEVSEERKEELEKIRQFFCF